MKTKQQRIIAFQYKLDSALAQQKQIDAKVKYYTVMLECLKEKK